MYPNGTFETFIHDSDFHVESGEYELFRFNFGDPNLVKIEYRDSSLLLGELYNHTIAYMKEADTLISESKNGKIYNEPFHKFFFVIYGEKFNDTSINCSQLSPCTIIVRESV